MLLLLAFLAIVRAAAALILPHALPSILLLLSLLLLLLMMMQALASPATHSCAAEPSAGSYTMRSLPGPGMRRSVARYWSPNACLQGSSSSA
jgi:hypothetical protein